MIECIDDLPENVLGLRAIGEVTSLDYQTVLVPALEEKLRSRKKVRLLYVLGDAFKGYTGSAAWEDAKVGLKHLSHFDRVGVVTDVDWVRDSVKALGFVMPCEVCVYGNEELAKARAWISEPPSSGHLSFDFLEDKGVAVLYPKGELEAADFARVAGEIDPYIAKKGQLRGLVIVAKHFPGWDDLGAFTAHLRFVREHRKKIARLAVVTDDNLLSAIPHIAGVIAVPEARHFAMDEKDDALVWASGGEEE